jgi:hypothetical protein
MRNWGWKKVDPVILAIALINIAVRLLVYDNLEYHRDELLYLALGQHPDFGYATVPPLIGWISWFLQLIFHNSLFAIRLFASLLGGVMIFLVAFIARELGSSRYGAILAATGLTVSIFFMRSFFLFHPVHIEIFLWTLSLLMVIKFINSGHNRYLIFFGITAGFAMLNKYLAGLLFLGLLLVIPFTRYRSIFSRRHFWLGMITGGLIFVPNIIWQALHGFPLINHMSELYSTQLVHMDAGIFLTEQLLNPFAGSIFMAAGLIYLLTARDAAPFRFLGFVALFVIIALLLLKGKSYYTLGIVPLLIAAGGMAWEKWLNRSVLRILLPLIAIIITIPSIPVGLPVWEKAGLKTYFNVLDQEYGIDLGRRFEDNSIHSLPQDYADMIGWDEFAILADSAYNMIGDKEAAIIYAENYGQAGAITVIGKKYDLPEAISFNESFRYWFPQNFPVEIKSVVYINHSLGDDIQKLFASIRLVGRISDRDAREYGAAVYLCEEPVSSFNDFWRSRIAGIR